MAKYPKLGKDGLLYLWKQIKITFVKKEDGKGLSTNDYTTDEKNKLSGVAEGAEKNAIQAISVNGDALVPNETTRNVEIKIPTKASDLSNDAKYQTADDVTKTLTDGTYQTASDVNAAISGKGYQTASDVNAAIINKGYQTASDVQAAINNSIGQMTGIEFKIVDSLPENGVSGTFYLVSNGGANQNAYDEYVWITKTDGTTAFEKIGTTDIDMSQYVRAEDVVDITNTEIDEIIASAES